MQYSINSFLLLRSDSRLDPDPPRVFHIQLQLQSQIVQPLIISLLAKSSQLPQAAISKPIFPLRLPSMVRVWPFICPPPKFHRLRYSNFLALEQVDRKGIPHLVLAKSLHCNLSTLGRKSCYPLAPGLFPLVDRHLRAVIAFGRRFKLDIAPLNLELLLMLVVLVVSLEEDVLALHLQPLQLPRGPLHLVDVGDQLPLFTDFREGILDVPNELLHLRVIDEEGSLDGLDRLRPLQNCHPHELLSLRRLQVLLGGRQRHPYILLIYSNSGNDYNPLCYIIEFNSRRRWATTKSARSSPTSPRREKSPQKG